MVSLNGFNGVPWRTNGTYGLDTKAWAYLSMAMVAFPLAEVPKSKASWGSALASIKKRHTSAWPPLMPKCTAVAPSQSSQRKRNQPENKMKHNLGLQRSAVQ